MDTYVFETIIILNWNDFWFTIFDVRTSGCVKWGLAILYFSDAMNIRRNFFLINKSKNYKHYTIWIPDPPRLYIVDIYLFKYSSIHMLNAKNLEWTTFYEHRESKCAYFKICLDLQYIFTIFKHANIWKICMNNYTRFLWFMCFLKT